MNIEEFTNRIKPVVSDALKKEVRIIKKLKVNGVTLYGIGILESNFNAGPVIYLEPFFEQFLETGNWFQTVEDVLAFYHRNKAPESFETEWLKDFRQVRQKLYYSLVNYDANRGLLDMVPHTRFLDLAKVYYIQCRINGAISGSILIYKEQMEAWGISEDELREAAEENTPLLYPACIMDMGDILGRQKKEAEGEIPFDFSPAPPIPMFVLSNREYQNGAVAICYKDILDDFSQKRGEDLVLLPSSRHEIIMIPFREQGDMDALREIVHVCNQTQVEREEFLSDNVYIFKRQDKQLIVS